MTRAAWSASTHRPTGVDLLLIADRLRMTYYSLPGPSFQANCGFRHPNRRRLGGVSMLLRRYGARASISSPEPSDGGTTAHKLGAASQNYHSRCGAKSFFQGKDSMYRGSEDS